MAATGRKERFQRRSDLTVNIRALIGQIQKFGLVDNLWFSNSSIIHKENTKEINVYWWVFGNQMKNCSLLHPWFLLVISFCLTSNIKHSRQSVSSGEETREVRQKYSAARRIFRLSSQCFIWRWNTASHVWYITDKKVSFMFWQWVCYEVYLTNENHNYSKSKSKRIWRLFILNENLFSFT